METISIGLEESLLLKLLPSFLIILGFAITIWRIRSEANSQKVLIEKQNKWEQDEKLKNRQEKYFEDFMHFMKKITKDKIINVDSRIELQYFTIVSIRLFDDEAITDALENAVKIVEKFKLESEKAESPQTSKTKEATVILNDALGLHLTLLIEFLKSNK
ncbi:MAG: hypothetical protein IIA58_01615 [Candidatus Marinimicrobia bacterium]|nr:hypothetical protein [Candidatus Neomarinimicrobiota bacterium]